MKDYKKILEGVVNIINTTEKSDIGFANICSYIGENCPELAESEDEKIRKKICKLLWDNAPYEEAQKYINYICRKQASTNSREYEEMKETCIFYLNKQKCYVNDTSCIKKCIAWLEKQGEKSNPYSGISFEYNGHIWGMCARDNGVDILLDKQLFKHLEKQGDTSVFYVPEVSIKDAVEVTSRMEHIEDDMKPIADFIIDYAYWDLHKDEWNQPTLTVPLFRVLDALIQRGKPYGKCSQNIAKQDEQKPYGQRKECSDCQFNYAGECKGSCQMKRDEQKSDNVEPKFHEGDWITIKE